MKYPLILIPEQLKEIQTLTIDDCVKEIDKSLGYNPPRLYQRKKLDYSRYLRQPNLWEDDVETTIGCLPYSGILITIAAIIWTFAEREGLRSFMMGFGYFTLLWFVADGRKLIPYGFRILVYKIKKVKYDKQMAEYDRLKTIEDEKYSQSEEKLKEYNKTFKKSNNSKKKKQELFEKIRTERLEKFKSDCLEPAEPVTPVTKGYTEDSFYKSLIKHFNKECILRNTVLPIAPFEGIAFYPDFVYKDEEGFYIDIEIDEPYTGVDKKVIHYFDEDTQTFSDDWRNTQFLGANWIVIRFAESQIAQFPDSCCKEIYKVLCDIKGVTPKKFPTTSDLELIKMWTRKEASDLAYLDNRKQYLNLKR